MTRFPARLAGKRVFLPAHPGSIRRVKRNALETNAMPSSPRILATLLLASFLCASPASSAPEPLPKPLEEAKRLETQAARLLQAGRHRAALPLAIRSLAITEKKLGPDHPRVAVRLMFWIGVVQRRISSTAFVIRAGRSRRTRRCSG